MDKNHGENARTANFAVWRNGGSNPAETICAKIEDTIKHLEALKKQFYPTTKKTKTTKKNGK